MRGSLVALLTALCLFVSASTAMAATPYYQALSVSDPANSDGVWGLFVAPDGSVVSNSDLDAEVGTTYSFVWSNGALSSPTNDLGCWSQCDTEATGINASGQVSGFTDATGADQAFVENEATKTVTYLRSNSEAYGINAAGQMVGGYRNAAGQERAFQWNGTTFTDLGTLGGGQAVATSTSDTGQAVGCAQTASGAWHPFVYKGGAMHDLGLPPGLSNACAYSSDQNGEIVGGDDVGPWTFPVENFGIGPSVGANACHAWIRSSAGKYTTIKPPTGSSCIVANHVALNHQVIGSYGQGTSEGHAYTWLNGTLKSITPANVPFDQNITTDPPEGDGPLSIINQGWGNNLYGQLAVTAYTGIPTWALLLTPITVDDEQAMAIKYAGSWSRITAAGAFGGHVKRASSTNATATLTFAGQNISVIGPVGPGLGSASIYLDGKLIATVSEAAGSSATRQRVFRHAWSTAGKHTLKIVASAGFELDAVTVAQV